MACGKCYVNHRFYRLGYGNKLQSRRGIVLERHRHHVVECRKETFLGGYFVPGASVRSRIRTTVYLAVVRSTSVMPSRHEIARNTKELCTVRQLEYYQATANGSYRSQSFHRLHVSYVNSLLAARSRKFCQLLQLLQNVLVTKHYHSNSTCNVDVTDLSV